LKSAKSKKKMNSKKNTSYTLTRGGAVASVLVTLLTGCGSGDKGTDMSEASSSTIAEEQLSVRKHKWEVSAIKEKSVLLGTFVTFCEGTKPKPQVKKIERRRKPGALVLTMFIEVPPKDPGCFGSEGSVMRWVKVGDDLKQLDLYDGSTSPPARRQEGSD
jgi:hypothetical protein